MIIIKEELKQEEIIDVLIKRYNQYLDHTGGDEAYFRIKMSGPPSDKSIRLKSCWCFGYETEYFYDKNELYFMLVQSSRSDSFEDRRKFFKNFAAKHNLKFKKIGSNHISTNIEDIKSVLKIIDDFIRGIRDLERQLLSKARAGRKRL